MIKDNDMIIREAARSICANQAAKQDNNDCEKYASGEWDQTIWVRLVEKGIRRGIEIGWML